VAVIVSKHIMARDVLGVSLKQFQLVSQDHLNGLAHLYLNRDIDLDSAAVIAQWQHTYVNV